MDKVKKKKFFPMKPIHTKHVAGCIDQLVKKGETFVPAEKGLFAKTLVVHTQTSKAGQPLVLSP